MRLKAIVCVALIGCSSASQAPPHHASAATYDAIAVSQERQAAEDEALYDPLQPPKRFCTRIMEREGACYTTENPTEQYLREAEDHRESAARYRSLADQLYAAEERACAGIPARQRYTSLFERGRDIASIEQTRNGAVITVHKNDMTATQLQRIVTCQLTRMDTLGHESDDPNPLAPQNVDATVRETPRGLAIEISSKDKSSIAEIQTRARALVFR